MTRCNQNHIGGAGVRFGRGCIHAGPLGLALALGAVTGATALSNPACPWWLVVIAFIFWPLFSIVGQSL